MTASMEEVHNSITLGRLETRWDVANRKKCLK